MNSCPTCGSKNVTIISDLKSIPLILFPINAAQRDVVREAQLQSYCCSNCCHIFQFSQDEEFVVNLYKDYYHLYPFKDLESMQAPYREPFQKVVDIFLKKQNATLLEVGCDNVEQIQPFLARGYSCTAINPGAHYAEAVNFIDGFYGTTTVNGKFDYVISRFNLEHISDFEVFFNALRLNLSSGGLVIVQVPNAEYFLNMGVLHIFAHEHHHYFCQASLLALIKHHDYEVVHISSQDEPSLICIFREKVSLKYNPRRLTSTASKSLNDLRQIIKYANTRIFLYGASLSLCGLLYAEGRADNESWANITVIDDNPKVEGRYMPNTHLEIVSLEKTHIPEDSIVVLVLNEIYHERVLKRLKSKGVKCRIMAITNGGIVDVDY